MKTVEVRLGPNSYEIHIGSGILSGLGHRLKQHSFSNKLVIITDRSLKRIYGDALEQTLIREGFEVNVLTVPEGEAQKSLETAGRLYAELSDSHTERTTPILALGGGVIGDLAGFVAATYLRGIPLVQIPTTLLAQVDSSIGGKVALDHGQLKNKIGAFYQPKLVVSDIATLRTLPPEELSNGLAEIIKYAVIRDAGFFNYLEENLERVRSLDSSTLEEVVFRSARIKAGIVEQDERDLGLRNILNYGHTIGHAVESASDFKLGHGQAVAIGMLAAGKISNILGMLSNDEHLRLKRIMERASLPAEIPDLNTEGIIQAMRHDKKIVEGKIRFILPKSIGEVLITDEVSLSLIKQALRG